MMNMKHLLQGIFKYDYMPQFDINSSRTSQFVYVPNKDLFFSTLDSHADALEGDVKPLVVLGSEGLSSHI